MVSGSSSGFRPGALHISLQIRKIQPRGWKKEQTHADLGQLQAQEGGSLCDTFVQLSVHLQAIAGVYFARNFNKATNNADIFSRWLTRSL